MHVFSADFCLATDKIMPENPYIHPMWTGSKNLPLSDNSGSGIFFSHGTTFDMTAIFDLHKTLIWV